VSKFETDIDLVSSRFIVDAKSLMGILSLDLTKPIEVRILNKQDERLINTIEKYAVA
jgi:phosphotransferase system HPr-like phosphotransfer protein